MIARRRSSRGTFEHVDGGTTKVYEELRFRHGRRAHRVTDGVIYGTRGLLAYDEATERVSAMPAADSGTSRIAPTRIAHLDDVDALAAEAVPHTVGVATDGRDEEAGARSSRVDPPALRIQ